MIEKCRLVRLPHQVGPLLGVLAHDFLQWSLSVETRLRISSSGDTRHASRVTIRPVPTRASCSYILGRTPRERIGRQIGQLPNMSLSVLPLHGTVGGVHSPQFTWSALIQARACCEGKSALVSQLHVLPHDMNGRAQSRMCVLRIASPFRDAWVV